MKDFWYGVDGIKDLRALLSLASLLTAFWYFGKKNKGNHDICCAVGQKRRAIEEVEMEREKRKEMEADGIKRGTLIKLPEWARSREGGDVTFLLLFFFLFSNIFSFGISLSLSISSKHRVSSFLSAAAPLYSNFSGYSNKNGQGRVPPFCSIPRESWCAASPPSAVSTTLFPSYTKL